MAKQVLQDGPQRMERGKCREEMLDYVDFPILRYATRKRRNCLFAIKDQDRLRQFRSRRAA